MTSQILREVRSTIIQRGWTQGRQVDQVTGADCLGGALLLVANRLGNVAGGRRAAAVVEQEIGGMLHPELWNDVPWRTQADVLSMLDRAIDRATRAEAVDLVPA